MSSHPHRQRWSPTLLVWVSMALHVIGLAAVVAEPGLILWVGAILVSNHSLLLLIGSVPQSRRLGANLSRLPECAARRREIALTFDDGPDPIVTPAILDLLDRYGARASFFCVGARAVDHPDLVREIVRRGHTVENHSYRHSNYFACYGIGTLYRDLTEAQRVLTEISGRPPQYFRAPMGLRSPLLDPVLVRTGLQLASWTRRGYDGVSGNPAAVLRRLLRRLDPGDILLLHDRPSPFARSTDPVILSVLPALLDHLERQSLRAVSLPAGLGEQRSG